MARQPFTTESYKKFRGHCMRLAYSHGMAREAEDFAAWATIRILEGRDASIDNLLKDYKRKTIGDSRRASGKVKQQQYNAIPIEDPQYVAESNRKIRGIDPRTEIQFFQLADKLDLTLWERVCFLLRYRECLNTKEIAYYFKDDQSLILAVLAEIERKIRDNADSKDYLDMAL